MKVFLAYSFKPRDRELVAKVDRLLASQDVKALTGTRLGGAGLTQEVQRRIEGCDALVALLTRREEIGEGRWSTHQWVRDELLHARSKGKPAIPLVESGVDIEGSYADNERIDMSDDDPAEALVALAETVKLWREQVGLARHVQLTPDEIGQLFRRTAGMSCRYRVVDPNGDRNEWRSAPDPIAQGGGTLVYLEGIGSDAHYIEVEVMNGDTRQWYSDTTAQLITVKMHEAS
jgi:hypothetical protein